MTEQAVVAHTPGPWITRMQRSKQGEELGWIIETENGSRIGWSSYADIITNEGDLPESAPNARLMAGAPTMAEALLWIRENLHPKALGRGATDAELYAITHATFALRAAGVIPTPELQP